MVEKTVLKAMWACRFSTTTVASGAPNVNFGKYLFRRRFEIQNFRNICCKISFLPASPMIFEHIWHNCPLLTDSYPKRVTKNFREPFFQKVSFDPYNFRITGLSARKSDQMKNFYGIKICLYIPFKY